MKSCANATQVKPTVLLVVALPVEARPLIDCYQLKACHLLTVFNLYQSSDHPVALVVSGIGKVNSAMATAWALAQCPMIKSILNVGVAGGSHHSIGSIWLANKVTDGDTGYSTYPMMTDIYPIESTALLTVAKPMAAPENALVDMEASGFLQAATRFCPQELVHCLKIVSDNTQQSHHQLDGKQIGQLLTAALPVIDRMVDKLNQAVSFVPQVELQANNSLAQIALQHHMTTYQRHQLGRVLAQLYAQYPQQADAVIAQYQAEASDIRSLLMRLQGYLHDGALRL